MPGRSPLRVARARLIALTGMAGLAVLLAVQSPQPAAADPVEVRAGLHPGYGRLVFEWPRPVPYTASIEGGALFVEFQRPIEADLARIRRTLGRYATNAVISADGRTVRVDLNGSFGVRDYAAGNTVVVDLLDAPADAQPAANAPVPLRAGAQQPAQTAPAQPVPSASAQPAAQPAAPPAASQPAASSPAAAGNAPRVGVRTGVHETYTRLVFDWSTPTAYQVARTGDTVTLTFDRPARFDLGTLNSRPPRHVVGAAADGDPARSVRLTVAPNAGIKDQRIGTRVVVDVLAPAATPPAAAPPGITPPAVTPPAATPQVTEVAAQTPPATQAAPAPSPGQPGDGPRRLAPAAAEAPATARTSSAPASPAAAQGGRAGAPGTGSAPAPAAGQGGGAPLAPVAALPPPTPSAIPRAAALTAAPAAQAAATAAPPSAAAQGPRPLRPELAAQPAPAQPGQPVSAQAGGADGAQPAARAAEASPVTAQPAAVAARAEATAAGVSLRFDWDEPVAAAVFNRLGALWIVFDKQSRVDTAQLVAGGRGLIGDIQQLPSPAATILRLATQPGINPTLRRDGLAWIFDFAPGPLATATPIDVLAQPDSPVGPRLFVTVAEPGRAVLVNDPATGDNLVVVPVIPLGHGLVRPRRYPELELLQTAHGVAARPLIDDLRVRPLRDGVEISSDRGLQVTANATRDGPAADAFEPMRPLTRAFDLEPWRASTPDTFTASKQRLQQQAATAQGAARTAARMELARFYLGQGFAHEAVGVLGALAASDEQAVRDPSFHALRGAANVLIGHKDEALADLGQPSLQNIDEVAFFKDILTVNTGMPRDAAAGLRRTGSLIRSYPRALKVPLGQAIVQAALDAGDLKMAEHYIDVLANEEPSPAEAARLGYLDGRRKELAGDFDGAVRAWEEVERSGHRPSRARAIKARVDLLLRQKSMERPQAIEELERLRFAWRGDAFEFDLLTRLGELYLAEGNYREGLHALRQAATYFRSHPDAPRVTQQMSDAFHGLYLEGGADTLPPITAIALYDEFKELTPSGEKGDEMIRRLAERLVAVDLMDRAAELLKAQIEFRMKGADRSKVGAKLALVHLQNGKSEQAIKTLDETQEPNLAPELVAERRYLRARALRDLGRIEDALGQIAGDDSLVGERLRADIYWRTANWAEAAKSLRNVGRQAGALPGRPLNEQQARLVLQQATALTLAGNDRATEQLRRDYGPAMAATPFADPFRLVTSPAERGLIDHRDVAAQVALAQKFQGFIQDYHEQLSPEPPSALR